MRNLMNKMLDPIALAYISMSIEFNPKLETNRWSAEFQYSINDSYWLISIDVIGATLKQRSARQITKHEYDEICDRNQRRNAMMNYS